MNDKGTIALSALAFGVGAAALLGVSEVSEADPPPGYYCAVGSPGCDLGVKPTFGNFIWHPWFSDNPSYQIQAMEAIYELGLSYYMNGTQQVYGQCTPAYNTCGCSTTYWVYDFYITPVGDPSQGNQLIDVMPYPSPRWAGRSSEAACYLPIGG